MKISAPISLLIVCCLLVVSLSSPIHDQEEASMYLQKFGYLQDDGHRAGSPEGSNAFYNAIKYFQRFAGLNQTGRLDKETIVLMNTPRCGVKDILESPSHTRKKRFAIEGSKWRKTDLTYRISKYSRRLKNTKKIDEEIARAFKVWSDVTTLSFEERKRGRVDIDIRFETGEHGDIEIFSKDSDTFAHAFFPNKGGDVHFDDEKQWTINENSGTNLFQVAAHEFGHTLGLLHSTERQALMYAYYTKYRASFKLDTDDVNAIQSLYPSRDQGAHSDPSPDTSIASDLCKDSSIDTITQTQDGNIYVFKGAFYWKLKNGIADNYPRKIFDDWDGLEVNLDASLTGSNGKTYFFKGGRYWRYRNKERDSGYPKLIARGFEGIPSMIDAVLVWNGNNKTYFFKGDKYWRYDGNNDPPVGEDYPKSISRWNGLPNNLDAAIPWRNGRSYFFKGTKYYRFNDRSFQVDTDNPPFPRSTATGWFACDSISN